MPGCPKCQTERVVKNGQHLGRQRYRCKGCGFQYTRVTPRGRPATEKALAILLYTMGLSMNAIAGIYKVSAQSVLRWVRKFAENTYEKPEARKAAVVEPDEMWHYLGQKKTTCGYGKLIVALPVSSLTRNVGLVIKQP